MVNNLNPLTTNQPISLMVNQKKIDLTLMSGRVDYDYPISAGTKTIDIERNEKNPLFVTSSHTWIDRSNDVSPQEQNIRYLDYISTGVTKVISDTV